MIILALAVLLQGASADSATLELLERTAAAYQSSRTLQGSFTQLLSNPRTGNAQASRGAFYQQGAHRFAFRYSEPAEDVIAADSVGVWIYLPSAAKGQAIRLPRAMAAGLDLSSALLRDLRRRYTVSVEGDTLVDGVAVKVALLVPRTPDSPFSRATLWLDPRAMVIRRVRLTEHSGLQRTITFTSVRVGAPIPSDRFEFVAPPGVRVIDQVKGVP